MVRDERADLHGIGSYEKFTTANRKRFFETKYRQFPHLNQCKNCSSDYMRYSIDGFCQRCQQRAEFVIRERLTIVTTARGSRK